MELFLCHSFSLSLSFTFTWKVKQTREIIFSPRWWLTFLYLFLFLSHSCKYQANVLTVADVTAFIGWINIHYWFHRLSHYHRLRHYYRFIQQKLRRWKRRVKKGRKKNRFIKPQALWLLMDAFTRLDWLHTYFSQVINAHESDL